MSTNTNLDNLLAEADDESALREAWVAKGRPADPADPYWARVLASQAAPRPSWVEPLVRLA